MITQLELSPPAQRHSATSRAAAEDIAPRGNVKGVKCGTTHGRYNSRAYESWEAMKQRCQNPNSQNWKRYGARGWDHVRAVTTPVSQLRRRMAV